MSVISAPAPSVGELLRDWRQRRRLSQLDLALDAEVSARHLSFVETGRSKPSRELVLHLAEHLDVPLRERNALLLAAGYAPVYRETPLDDEAMAPVRDALDKILAGHEPFPAWSSTGAGTWSRPTRRRWRCWPTASRPSCSSRRSTRCGSAAPRRARAADRQPARVRRAPRWPGCAPGRAGPRSRAVRAARGAARLSRHARRHDPAAPSRPTCCSCRCGCARSAHELRFFSTLATFGTALDITVAELAIESFFPADRETEDALRGLDRG